MPKTTKTSKHVCSNCLELFAPKDICSATKPGENYSTYYCTKCINDMGITEYVPYLKPRTKKVKQ